MVRRKRADNKKPGAPLGCAGSGSGVCKDHQAVILNRGSGGQGQPDVGFI
jgi:hypothetical protein